MIRCLSTCNEGEYKYNDYAVWQINNTNGSRALADIRQYFSVFVACRVLLVWCYCCKNRKRYRSCFTFSLFCFCTRNYYSSLFRNIQLQRMNQMNHILSLFSVMQLLELFSDQKYSIRNAAVLQIKFSTDDHY